MVWEFISSIHSIGPFIPLELTEIGDVSLLTKGIKVRILALELEQGPISQIVDAHPELSTETPQDHRCNQFVHLLSDRGLGEANISFINVGMLGIFFEDIQGGAQLVAYFSYFSRSLIP